MSSEQELSCRICLEEGGRSEFIAPCACRGTSKWVHRHCLNRWRCVREDRAFSQCTECLQQYKLIPKEEVAHSNNRVNCSRCVRFTCYVLRDTFTALLITTGLALLFSCLVGALDGRGHILAAYFRMGNHLLLFYLLAGWSCLFAIVGCTFLCVQSGCIGRDSIDRCTGSHRCDCGPIYPIYYAPAPGCDCFDCYLIGDSCCCDTCCEGSCCHACAHGGGSCCECSGGECASNACDVTAVGHECVPILLVVLLLLVTIGAVVCVFIGIFAAQNVIRTHWQVLYKYSVSEEYIVADLAEDEEADRAAMTERDHLIAGKRTTNKGIEVIHLHNTTEQVEHNQQLPYNAIEEGSKSGVDFRGNAKLLPVLRETMMRDHRDDFSSSFDSSPP